MSGDAPLPGALPGLHLGSQQPQAPVKPPGAGVHGAARVSLHPGPAGRWAAAKGLCSVRRRGQRLIINRGGLLPASRGTDPGTGWREEPRSRFQHRSLARFPRPQRGTHRGDAHGPVTRPPGRGRDGPAPGSSPRVRSPAAGRGNARRGGRPCAPRGRGVREFLARGTTGAFVPGPEKPRPGTRRPRDATPGRGARGSPAPRGRPPGTGPRRSRSQPREPRFQTGLSRRDERVSPRSPPPPPGKRKRRAPFRKRRSAGRGRC